ncbi:MAG: MFS transporter [Deltaproteobacteria bacterium]|nr:MFS transporter [Deltaproteobacteria bacterium]
MGDGGADDPLLATSFAITPGTAAQLVTAVAIGRFAGMPVSGFLLDRFGARTALIAEPLAACLSALLAAVMPWFALILIAVFFIGVADNIWVIAREIAGVDLVRADQRGRVLSGFHGMNYIVLAVGPLIGGILTEQLGFRAVFVAYDVVPPNARGRLQAARRTIAEIGSVSAPLLGGYLVDKFNPSVPFLAYAPFLILSAILLATVAREILEK